MHKSSIALLSFAAVLAVVVLTIWGVNNSLAGKDQAVRAAASQVQNQQQRRADLIDNLVETVKGYAGHESSTLAAVIAARQGGPNAGERSGSLISALTEQYPNLKADRHFADLQKQIEGTENRMMVARRDQILRIQEYNTALSLFPASLVNRTMLGYAPKEEFTIDDADKARPKVNFSSKG